MESRVHVLTCDHCLIPLSSEFVATSTYLQSAVQCHDSTPLPITYTSYHLNSLISLWELKGKYGQKALEIAVLRVFQTAKDDSALQLHISQLCSLSDFLGCEELLEVLLSGVADFFRNLQLSPIPTEEQDSELRAKYPWADSYL